MSAGVETSPCFKSLTLPAPQIRPARLEDYEEIGRFHAFDFLLPDDWRRLWLDNPLWPRVGNDLPIGWVLETRASEIVGTLLNVPSSYKYRGTDLVSAFGFAWSVAPPYRGFALQLTEEYFNQQVDLYINTTVGPEALEPIGRSSARVPLGDWQTFSYCATDHLRLAKKALQKFQVPLAGLLAYPASGALWLKDTIQSKALHEPDPAFTIEATDRFDARFDAFWDQLVRQNPDKLLAERSSRALSWHYSIPLSMERLWIFTASKNRQLRAYCVLKRQYVTRGVRRMRLVDYQSIEQDANPLPSLLQAALRRCTAERYYIVENLGVGVPKMRDFDEYAPYRKKLTNWQFFYHAADPALEADLRQPTRWDPSAFDGDASFQ
jgi:hypothetical protein